MVPVASQRSKYSGSAPTPNLGHVLAVELERDPAVLLLGQRGQASCPGPQGAVELLLEGVHDDGPQRETGSQERHGGATHQIEKQAGPE
jgi:hypothetical protein